MDDLQVVSLSSETHFSVVSGLWTGKKSPLVRARVLRSTNFRGDGLFDYENVAELDVEQRELSRRQLRPGDIVIERSGGGPKQPVGRVAFFDPPDEGVYATSNFTTALRVNDPEEIDPEYVSLYLHAYYQSGGTASLQRATTGIRNLDWAEYRRFHVPVGRIEQQKKVAALLGGVRQACLIEEQQLEFLGAVKRASLVAVFTRGLHGAQSTNTVIGQVPDQWSQTTLGEECAKHGGIIQTGPFGSQLHAGEYRVTGTPVINPTHLAGNRISHEDTPRVDDETVERLARHKVRVDDILFARRGEIGRHGVVTREEDGWLCGTGCFLVRTNSPDLDSTFASYLLSTDGVVRWLTEHATGTIMPNLNNTVLSLLPIAFPDLDEQHAIVDILGAIDKKIALHESKRAVLYDLFKALLHKLMTREIRVTDLNLEALAPPPAAATAP